VPTHRLDPRVIERDQFVLVGHLVERHWFSTFLGRASRAGTGIGDAAAAAMRNDVRVTLLDEIQTAATDPSLSLSDLLRKCQILAFRLRHEPFREWVSHELNGYPDEVTPPPYRTSLRGSLKADVTGPFGSGYKNVQVPLSLFPVELRDEVDRFKFYQGVATLERLIADAERTGDTRIMSMFPVEMSANMSIVRGYQTMTMWCEVPVASVVGVLDQVRSRALEFVLEIEAENPDAGASATKEPPIALAKTDSIFNTVIYGGQNAIGPGATVNVTPGDLGSLLAFLEAQGVAKADRDELEVALADDKGKLGPRVKVWLGGMSVKAASFGGGVAVHATGALIAAGVLHYFGLP